MGGKALNNICYTRRYSREEYDKVIPEIVSIAKELFTDVHPTTFYKEKDSFGDADILVLLDKPLTINLKEWIKEKYNSKGVEVNSNCYSFEYKELQVDFILTPLSNWETSKIYFSYNDIHNLIGKLFHKFGLKWGFDGLKYPYRLDGKMMGDISVSKDWRECLSFVGLDPDRYADGFNNLDEIFDYVITSKYFNPWLYDLENLNRINRERDKKRATYAKFLERIEPMKERGKDAYFYFHPEKKYYLGLIDHYFPGFLKEYKSLEDKEVRKRKVHSLFNGNILMERFGVKGTELGKLIGDFQKTFSSKEEMEDWIIEVDDTEVIIEKVKELIN